MERDNRDEDMMLKGTKQEMPGFRFRLLRPEKKRELWNPDFELLFLLRGSGRVSYEDGEVHNLPMGSIFAINRFQICDLDLDEDGLALSLCVSAETIASFHIKLLKCEVKCQSFFYMEDQQEKFDLIRRDMARIFLEMYKNNEEQPIYSPNCGTKRGKRHKRSFLQISHAGQAGAEWNLPGNTVPE